MKHGHGKRKCVWCERVIHSFERSAVHVGGPPRRWLWACDRVCAMIFENHSRAKFHKPTMGERLLGEPGSSDRQFHHGVPRFN